MNIQKSLMDRHFQNDLVSRQECEEIFLKISIEQNIPNGILIDYEIVPELSSIGYLGEYFHLYLKYRKNGNSELLQLRLFVKTKPYQNPEMSELIERAGMLRKEATLYNQLLNKLRTYSPNLWCAQCYLVKPDLFVMQNIMDLGYEPLKDSKEFLNKFQIQSILKGLATLHASSLKYENERKMKIGEEFKEYLNEMTVSPNVVWFTAGIKAILSVALSHPSYQSQTIQNFIKTQLPEIFNSVYDMINPSSKYCNVFCHRDVWGGNVFFAREDPYEKGAVFVDFQLCRYSPAALDILMTLYINMKPRDRKLIEKESYEIYYENFSKELKNMSLDAKDFMTFEDFEKSLKEFALFGVLYNCICATILRVPGDYLKDMKLNRPDDFHRYTNIDRTKEVMELVKINPNYKEYIYECIEDMMELLM